jgi:zinc transporter, ZIP family
VGALASGFWGFVGGASLLLGALMGIYAGGSRRTIATVMAFGAGVLISSVAFELMNEAYQMGASTRHPWDSCSGAWPSSSPTGK